MNRRCFFLFLILAMVPLAIGERAGADQAPLKIGVISNLTGAFSEVGIGASRAIQLACEQWNSDRRTPPVSCLVEDDGFDAKKGNTAYLKFKAEKVDAIINVGSTTHAAIAPQVRRDGIPMMQVFLESSPSVSDNIFQICPDMSAAEEMLGKRVAERYRAPIALVTTINDAVNGLAAGFERGVGSRVIREDLPAETTDMRSAVLRLLRSKPGAIMFITFPTQGALIEKELRALKSEVPRVFDANFVSAVTEYEKVLGDLSSLNDSLLLNLEFPQSPERAAFRADYLKRWGGEVPPWAEYSYDAFAVLMRAYTPERGGWSAAIQKTAFDGVSGRIEFNAAGATIPRPEFITVGELLSRRSKGAGSGQ